MKTTWQWAIALAGVDPTKGQEQKGTRPVLIVSNEAFNQAMPGVSYTLRKSK